MVKQYRYFRIETLVTVVLMTKANPTIQLLISNARPWNCQAYTEIPPLSLPKRDVFVPKIACISDPDANWLVNMKE